MVDLLNVAQACFLPHGQSSVPVGHRNPLVNPDHGCQCMHSVVAVPMRVPAACPILGMTRCHAAVPVASRHRTSRASGLLLVLGCGRCAQSTPKEHEKTFAVDALEALQRQCPMSMAVTLRHYSQVHQAVQAGVRPPRVWALQHHPVGIPPSACHSQASLARKTSEAVGVTPFSSMQISSGSAEQASPFISVVP